MVDRFSYPYIPPFNTVDKFKAPYILFFDSIYDVLGQGVSTIVIDGQQLYATNSTLNLDGNVDINGVSIDSSGTVNNILTADTITTTSFSTPLAGIVATGEIKRQVGSTLPSGWIWMDEGTIGSGPSGATNRANADTEDLYTKLWNTLDDTICPVSTGRGISAAADFAANKTLQLPPAPGRTLGAYGSGSGLTSRTLGQSVGEETHTITTSEMGPHGHWYPYNTTVGTTPYSARSIYGSFGALEMDPGDTPDLQQLTNNNTGGTARPNIEKTTFFRTKIKL